MAVPLALAVPCRRPAATRAPGQGPGFVARCRWSGWEVSRPAEPGRRSGSRRRLRAHDGRGLVVAVREHRDQVGPVARARRNDHDATVCSAARVRTSGPVAVCTVVDPPALTENATSTLPLVPPMRAKGGITGRRPVARSGTPSASVTSRTAETPFSATGGGGGAVMTSIGGGAVRSAGAVGDGTREVCAGGAFAGTVAGVTGAADDGGVGGRAAGCGARRVRRA